MNKTQKLSILKLFNKALSESKKYDEYYIKELLKFGVVCSPYCDYEVVYQYINEKKFNPNATFYKTIEDVTDKTRLELFIDQMVHYFTTYGTDFQARPFIVNDAPIDISQTFFIDTVTEEEVTERCRNMLYSGIALSQETIENILIVLDNNFELKNIKNKEALCIICTNNDIYPDNAEDIVRVLVYKATDKSLLIKDKATLQLIAQSATIIPIALAEKLSEVFHRYKDIFISFKSNPLNKHTVNRIRKLAKKNHKPFVPAFWSNVLSMQKDLAVVEKKVGELNNFKKISLLNTCLQYIYNDTNIKPYVIRNGKLWIDIENRRDKEKLKYFRDVFDIIYQSLIQSIEKNKCEIILPESLVVLAPTSEKNFMGEIPIYSYISLKNNAIIGINWKEKDGAKDLDLSMINTQGGKIGWNADFYDEAKSFIYSGDMTTADPEATELLYRKNESDVEGIVKVNPYHSQENAKYTVFFAQEPITKSKFRKNYSVHPENIIYRYEDTISSEKILGVFADNKFIFCNFKLKNKRVSEQSITDLQLIYLKQIHKHLLSLEQILTDAGFIVTKSKDCVLSKDTVIKCLY